MSACRMSFALLIACWYSDMTYSQSFGPWRIPGTPAQYFGHGFGAGHHAPMVRSPGVKPPYVPRVAFDNSRVSAHGLYCQQSAVLSHSHSVHYHNSFPGAMQHAPTTYSQPVIQHPQISQPTLAAPPKTFASPAKPAKPKVLTEKKPVKNEMPKPKPKAQAQAKPPKTPMKPLKITPPVKQKRKNPLDALPKLEEDLPQPAMPTTDPTVVPNNNNDQASYSF